MEIKFRGKRLDNGQVVYGGYHKHMSIMPSPMDTPDENNIIYMIIRDGFADWNMHVPIEGVPVDPDTIEQCTGCTDSYGNEIWQGDEVELVYATWFAEENDCESDKGIVDFEDGCFIIRIEGDEFTPAVNNSFCTSIKCISTTK